MNTFSDDEYTYCSGCGCLVADCTCLDGIYIKEDIRYDILTEAPKGVWKVYAQDLSLDDATRIENELCFDTSVRRSILVEHY